jgi:hypothetical protein
MLSNTEQEKIVRENNRAFEELAKRWRNPETGQTEPDLCRAVLEMVCQYFSTPRAGASDLYLDQCIEYLQAELRSIDIELGFALPEDKQELNASEQKRRGATP